MEITFFCGSGAGPLLKVWRFYAKQARFSRTKFAMVANSYAAPITAPGAHAPALSTFVIGISSSALFDTRESDAYFQNHDLEKYVTYQIEREDIPFPDVTSLF